MIDTSDPPSSATRAPTADVALECLELSHELVVLTDIQGRIGWANRTIREALGSGVACGAALHDLLPPGDAGTEAREALRKALGGSPPTDTPLQLQTPTGTPLWVRVRTATVNGGIAWMLQDVTQAVAERQRADHLAELLDMAQELGRLGIWERDIPSGKGRWDRHVFDFFGVDPGGPVPDFEASSIRIHPDDHPAMQDYHDSTLRAGRYAQRYRLMRPDGSSRRMHSQWKVKNGPSGRPDRAIGIVMDETEAFELARSLGSATEQLNLAADVTNLVTCRHDLHTDLMFYSDRAFTVLDMPARADGIPAAEVHALIHPDDLARVLAATRQTIESGGPVDVEARYRRRDGSWRHVMTRRVVQRSAGGQALAFLGVALDVTDQMEHTRRASEVSRRLNAAAQVAGVGIWSTAPGTERPEWNEQMFDLFDMDRTAAPPTLLEWIANCVHPEDRARVSREASDYLRTGDGPAEFELRTQRRDGSSRWIVLRADVDRSSPLQRRLLGVALDVTEHREALAALRTADQRAALAARSAGIGTWQVDLISGVENWDEQMFTLRDMPWAATPPPREERMALLHPEDTHLVLDSQHTAVSADESSQYEFRVRLSDGTFRWLASRSIPVRDAQGRSVRRVGVNWDVTEARHAQVALQEKAIAESESQAKSQFLSRMSHELRTPLNAVLGFTQLLQREADPRWNAEQRRQLGHVRAAGEHLLALINDVLELSSLESGRLKLNLQSVDLRAVVKQALPLVESLTRKQQVVLRMVGSHRAADEEPVRAWGDSTRVLQVLLNLLSNAIKYNRLRGEVTIQLDNCDGATARARIADTGRGMTPAQITHLFEPFNRLGIENEGIEGTGIGLVIVKALVEGMGGTLGVTSQAGRGTTFELKLPRPPIGAAPAREFAHSAPAPAEPLTRGRHGRLLYIEDNAVNVLLVQELVCTMPGLSLTIEVTGAQGVQRAATLLPDLVLVDMQLPDFDGFEVLRRLRSQPQTRSIPCIALSANAMPEDITKALQAGFEAYWTKPIDFKAFVSALEQRFPLTSAHGA